jgi:hypothetical protein
MMSTGSTGSLFNMGSPEARPRKESVQRPLQCPFTGRCSVGRPVVGFWIAPRADGHLPDGRMCR